MEFGACFRHESKDGAVSEYLQDVWNEGGVNTLWNDWNEVGVCALLHLLDATQFCGNGGVSHCHVSMHELPVHVLDGCDLLQILAIMLESCLSQIAYYYAQNFALINIASLPSSTYGKMFASAVQAM